MLKTLRKWWNQEDNDGQEPELHLAVTKLMVGMMSMDGHMAPDEREEISALLQQHYQLSLDESEALIDQALNQDRDDLQFSKVVSQVEKSFSVEERAQILRKIWAIALADGDIDFMEEQYINRLSALIGVPTTLLNELKEEQERLYPNLNQSRRYQDPAQA